MTVTLEPQGVSWSSSRHRMASSRRRARHAVQARRRTRERMVHVNHNPLTTRDLLWYFDALAVVPGCEVQTVPSGAVCVDSWKLNPPWVGRCQSQGSFTSVV